MDEYSLSDVSKILKIERPRLQEWLRLNFVHPSYASPVPGSKALFSVDDLYSIQLFVELLETGFNRIDAAFVVSKVQRSFRIRKWSYTEPPCNWEEDFLNISKSPPFKDQKMSAMEKFRVTYGDPEVSQYFETKREATDNKPYWHLIIRLKEIKTRVDRALG
jgi:hypothetical protein